jgi:hypothetical protein
MWSLLWLDLLVELLLLLQLVVVVVVGWHL